MTPSSMKMENHPSITCCQNIVFIIIWNVAGEFVSLKNMTVGLKSPSGVRKATFHSSPSVTHGLCVGVITDTLVITELRGVRVVQIP